MSDKSPRQAASKKSAKSIKEKRAIKKLKKAADSQSSPESTLAAVIAKR